MNNIDGVDEFKAFIETHGIQLETSGVPRHLWHVLFKKIINDIFDAGESFLMAETGSGLSVFVKKSDGISCNDSSSIFLIDHAWTFEARAASSLLTNIPGLLQRMAMLMNVSLDLPIAEQISDVCTKMWSYARPYCRKLTSTDPPTTFWYVMDEFGSSIQHSSSPNFRAIPFLYHPNDTAYTILFPTIDVEEDDEVTVDYVEGVGHQDNLSREALLVPWTGKSFVDLDLAQEEPHDDYFLSGTSIERLPEVSQNYILPSTETLRVYTEYEFVTRYLKHPGFVLVDNIEEADILWLTRHFTDFHTVAGSQTPFVNQFPCEHVITTKDLLCIVARRATKDPKWLPSTYNLMTELPLFVSVFQKREANKEDNHWICKPWNLARALDTTISNNLNCILRLPFSGPKIAQKYAEKPVLFNRPGIGLVKFDIRYVILLESVQPLKLYCFKEFFLRFANKPFELDDLWDYEKHFTVMNYHTNAELHHVRCEQFKQEFHEQYPNYNWDSIEAEIMSVFWEVFHAASSLPPPRGIPSSSRSRALYAADLILTWSGEEMQPQLLEINFGPDCERACLYYPDFYDNIFGLLFKGEENSDKFITVKQNVEIPPKVLT